MLWTLLLSACSEAPVEAPLPVATAPAEVKPDPTPTADRKPDVTVGPPDHGVSMAAVIMAASPHLLRVATAQGELELPVRDGAFRDGSPVVGQLVKLDVGLGSCGEFIVVGSKANQGLPIQFGRVTEKTAEQLTIQAPNGSFSFKIHPVSDVTKGVDVGAWVSVKSFTLEDQPTILNARAHPGKVEDVGVITEVEATRFKVLSLSGERCWRGDPGGFTVGDGVIVNGTWRGNQGFTATSVRHQAFPATFIGKLQAKEDFRLTAVDAWGAYLGRVDFTMGIPCDSVCQDIVAGDLMEVDWHFDGTEPTVDALRERPLSPVFFGKIDRIGPEELTLTTLQEQTKYLKITPETVQAQLVEVGDFADVVYKADPGGGTPTAVLIAKR